MIITDGPSLDFLHRLLNTHTHKHIHSQYSSTKTACWRITDDQHIKRPVFLQVKNSESLPAPKGGLQILHYNWTMIILNPKKERIIIPLLLIITIAGFHLELSSSILASFNKYDCVVALLSLFFH